MNPLSSDKSVFEINNRYPVKHKLHEGADILVFDDFLKKPDEYKDVLQKFPVYKSDFFYPTASPGCLLYTSPSPRDRTRSRMQSSA